MSDIIFLVVAFPLTTKNAYANQRERERGGSGGWGRKAHISTSKWGTWDVCVEGWGGAKLCEARVKCLTIQKTIQNFSRRSSRVCLAALRVPLLLPSPSSPPSPLHATQLQLHCELNCNEAHAAAKYENEKQKCVLHGSVQGGRGGDWVEFGIALKKWQLTVMFAVPTRCRQF